MIILDGVLPARYAARFKVQAAQVGSAASLSKSVRALRSGILVLGLGVKRERKLLLSQVGGHFVLGIRMVSREKVSRHCESIVVNEDVRLRRKGIRKGKPRWRKFS